MKKSNLNFLFTQPLKKPIVFITRNKALKLNNLTKNDDICTLYYLGSRKDIYFFPLLKAILLAFFSKYNGIKKIQKIKFFYFQLIFKNIRPKIILTTIDNDPFFYYLKNFYRNSKYIVIQNGKKNYKYLTKVIKYYGKENKLTEANIDYFFSYGKLFSKFFKRELLNKTKFIEHGSIINNSIPIKNNFSKKKIICLVSDYVSSWGSEISEMYNGAKIKKNNYYKADKFIINLLSSYCEKKRIKLLIITKNNFLDNENEKKLEKNFFYSSVKKKKNLLFSCDQNISIKEKHLISDTCLASFGFGISSLDFEIISRGNKFCFFNHKALFLKKIGFGDYGFWFWPEKFRKDDFFFINSFNSQKVLQEIDKFIKINLAFYKLKKNKIENKFITYDFENKKLKNLIHNISLCK